MLAAAAEVPLKTKPPLPSGWPKKLVGTASGPAMSGLARTWGEARRWPEASKRMVPPPREVYDSGVWMLFQGTAPMVRVLAAAACPKMVGAPWNSAGALLSKRTHFRVVG